MRDGEARAELGQRVGIGGWLIVGLALAVLAFQTTLISAETVNTSELGASTALAPNTQSVTPQLPAATPNLVACNEGSNCPSGPTNGTTPVTAPVPVVAPAEIPANGDALPCGQNGGAGIASTGSAGVLIFSDVDPCDADVEALKAMCTFTISTLGYGNSDLTLSTSTPLATGDTAEVSVDAVGSTESKVFEQFDCNGTTVTVARDVYVD